MPCRIVLQDTLASSEETITRPMSEVANSPSIADLMAAMLPHSDVLGEAVGAAPERLNIRGVNVTLLSEAAADQAAGLGK